MRKFFVVFTALIAACGSTDHVDRGTIFTASSVLIGASQTPTRNPVIAVVDGMIREVGSA